MMMYKKGDIVNFTLDRGNGIFEKYVGEIVVIDTWKNEETSYDIAIKDINGNKTWCKHVLDRYIRK